MNSQNPYPDPPPPSPMLPSNSTNASIIGGAIATLVIYSLGAKGITLPAGAEAAVAALASAIAGYFPASGRRP